MSLIVLGVYDMSTLMGHFVSSPREREKRDRRDENSKSVTLTSRSCPGTGISPNTTYIYHHAKYK